MVFLMYFWFVLHKGRKILIMFIALLRSKSVYLRHCNKNGYILQNFSLLKLPGSLNVEAYFIESHNIITWTSVTFWPLSSLKG